MGEGENYTELDGSAPHEDEVCIDVQGLWKIFGPKPERILKSELRSAGRQEILEETGCVVAVRDVSFTILRNEFFVFMGLSGSGKSTLIRLVLRLLEPTTGNILIDGNDVCAFNKQELMNLRRHTTGMVFQNYGLFPHRTVLDNVAYGLQVRGVGKDERYEKAREAIETVQLKGWEDYLPVALSGGMQQRVGLARALATDPEILLMDEPFSGLDPLIRREMQDELIEIQDKIRKTIIFVTHDLDEALKLGCRIAIMKDGKIVQVGTPEEVITAPSDDYVRDFVQDVSPAKVLSAGTVMQQPANLLYEWQGPKAAMRILESSDRDHMFLVTRSRRHLGLVTVERLNEIISRKSANLLDSVEPNSPTTGPDATLEDLFPLAAATTNPIAVVDEHGKFLGEIRARTILSSLIQEEEA
jgi:glycine betaine/proline transport system ATP-binding protein